MEGVRSVIDILREHSLIKGRLRGLFHLLIAKSLSKSDGTVLCRGLTWRQLAAELKSARLDKHLVNEVGLDPETLSPRDRERFWYMAISMADVSGAEARKQADQLLKALKPHGIVETVTQQPPRDATSKRG